MTVSNSTSILALSNKSLLDDGIINSVIRALAILDLLGQSDAELGITEISRELSLHKSTVFRLISTLMVAGYVQQNPKNEKYHLGIHIAQLGMNVLNRIDLRRVAKPFLNELMSICNEAVHLGVLDKVEVIYIDKIDVERPLTMGSRIGGKSPGYCTGLGKVLLAYASKDAIEQLLSKGNLTRYTSNTITDHNSLIEHLARIRDQGYAVDDEEHELGIRCVAVPIRDYQGHVIAALSVSGPTLRMTREKLDQVIPKIIEIGGRISQSLGYNPEL